MTIPNANANTRDDADTNANPDAESESDADADCEDFDSNLYLPSLLPEMLERPVLLGDKKQSQASGRVQPAPAHIPQAEIAVNELEGSDLPKSLPKVQPEEESVASKELDLQATLASMALHH